MSNKIILDPEAGGDIDEIAAYIAARNLDAGLRFYESTDQMFERLAEMPGIGMMRPMENLSLAGLRMIPIPGFENHLVFYLPLEAEGVRILRVLHGAQDVEAIFSLPDER